jgi:hypothetical protein
MGFNIWWSSLFPKRRKRRSPLEQGSKTQIDIQDLIDYFELGEDNFSAFLSGESEVQATEEFLARKNVPRSGITIAEERERHHMRSQTVVLWSLVVPMSVIPFALIGLLYLSGTNKLEFDSSTEKALLGAIAIDYFGLYYIITRNLFPTDQRPSRRFSPFDPEESPEEPPKEILEDDVAEQF